MLKDEIKKKINFKMHFKQTQIVIKIMRIKLIQIQIKHDTFNF
jgi:hypothetical protein